ncbi:MAG TPA: TRAP transporter TatT component family protein [Vicinamibacterales bacterium]|nr:TRAP transporter TatT component family protein [Vicinamibacterales bacterium]
MAARAADIWSARAATDFDAAWKLARACYWLGRHLPHDQRRAALERGLGAAETAIRLDPQRPEGHYWLAADMGRLAEAFGFAQGLKYRGRIRSELERVIAIDPAWGGGAGDEALGEWYATVPRLLGGSGASAEGHFRRALHYDAANLSALVFLGEWLLDRHRADEADELLRRAISMSSDPEWEPEDRELRTKARRLLER